MIIHGEMGIWGWKFRKPILDVGDKNQRLFSRGLGLSSFYPWYRNWLVPIVSLDTLVGKAPIPTVTHLTGFRLGVKLHIPKISAVHWDYLRHKWVENLKANHQADYVMLCGNSCYSSCTSRKKHRE